MRIQLITNQPYIQPKYNFKNSDVKTISEETLAEKKHREHYGYAITIATFATVCSIFMLSRGFQKNTGKYLTKLKEFLEGKQELSSLKESKRSTKFYDQAIRSTNSFIKKTESINNITSLKDILFMKLMYKTKPTKQIHKSISDYFEKISRQTVLDSYEKTRKNFTKMNELCDKLDNFILKESPDEIIEYKGKNYKKRELVEEAKSHRILANTVAESFMSKESLDYRYDYINNVTSTLYSRFWDASFKDFWSKNNKFKQKEMWQTFIAAEQIKGNKTKLAENVALARNTLTYTNQDRIELISDYIKKLDGIVPANDKDGIAQIERLQWFAKHPEGLKDNKDIFLKELEKLQNHNFPIADKNLQKIQEECKESYLNTIKELFNETGTGEIQDMLSIYYRIAPFELSKSGTSLAVKKAVDSFDKSVDKETVEFFDKIRDLRLGSAPTDVLTIIISFLTLSAGLGYAKNKDNRTSIMFKSGIPIVGGIAAAIFTATKMVSGGKSLAFGLLSGIILNQLGNIANNIRKNKAVKHLA